MARATGGANAVSYRRTLFLTTAIVTLVTAMNGVQPASAQSVTSTGDLSYPAGGPTNPWSVGGNLYVGLFANGTLSITDGGKVDNAQGNIGVSGNSGTVTVSGTDAVGNASTWTNSGNLAVGRNGTGELIITAGGQVFSGQGNVGLIQPPPAAPASASGTVTVSGGDSAGNASTWWNSSLLLGPGGGSGTVTIKDGGAIVTTGFGYIGYEHGGDGTVMVTGHDANNASTWTLHNLLSVGEAGKGTLKIQDGGKVSNTNGYIGAQNSSADSIATVDGPGSSWTNTGFLRVGDQGTNAQLNITGGGTVTNTTGTIGNGALGDGTVTVSGSDGTNASTWTNTGDLVVGQSGKGTLKVLDGGKVSNVDGYIGAGSGSIGSVTVDGHGSTWASTGELRVGDQGTGSLTITGGGAVSNVADANIGNDTGSSGTVTVSGTDGSGNASTWTNNANLVVGNFGNGTLNILDGGQVINNVGYIGAQFTGTGVNDHSDVIVSGHDASGNASTWTSTSQVNIGDNGTGNITIQDGGVVNAQANANIGLNSDGSGNGVGSVLVTGRDINGHASTLNVAFTLIVGGDAQDNKLDILNGGVVNSRSATIGDTTFGGSNSKGTVTVSGCDANGNASTWNSGNIYAGYTGTGTLNILNGGAVNNSTGYIGYLAGSTGSVTVSGHDASGNASTWTNTGELHIGENGTGSLAIQDGGFVYTAQDGIIGYNNNGLGPGTGVGTVTVTGRDINGHASTWNVAGALVVGNDAHDNRLDILNGGVVNSGLTSIGNAIGGKGTITVSGRDANGNASAWNSGDIHVGDLGTGVLAIADGASVRARRGGAATVYLGYGVGSSGTVSVSSSTGNVSSLTSDGNIEVGSQGIGTMTVDKGGFVSAGSDVYIGRFGTASGTLQLNGDASGRGVLETGSVIKGAGTTTILDLNGGILRANRNEANFLNGFTALAVNTGGAWFDSNSFDIAIATDFSGTSSFNKLGLGQLTLIGDSSGFTGASTVSAGTLAVNGRLGGDMLVDTAGRLAGTGFVGNSVGNNLVNKGVVAPGYGGAMGTLTIQGNYASNGGRLEIATVLGDDSSQTSRLVVNGATIAGSTQVDVINRGGLGAQTVNGIKIIDVAGASDGTFVLNGNYVFQGAPAVIAGAYAYRLYQGGVSTPTDGDWYLRSELLNPPGGPSGPGGPVTTPLYQPGVPIYESYGSNLQSLNTLPTLEQRVGSRFWSAGANGDGNGIWGRTEGTHGRFDPAFSTTGLNQNIDTWKMQAGADRVFVDNASGRLVAGINVSYGNAYSQISSAFGNGSLKTDGYSLGATLTWYGVQDFYVDAQAQVSRYSSDLTSELRGTLGHDNVGSGEAVSIEAGKRISFGERFGITPQVQMVYSNVQFDRFIDTAGADVTADRNDSFKTRWGVALDHQGAWEGGRSRIYGIANVSYEWLDGARTLVAGTPIINADERLWGELGIGASMTWRKDLTVYGELSGNTPFRGFGNSYIVKGNVGLRAQF